MGTFMAAWPRPRAELAGYSLAVGVAVREVITARYVRRVELGPEVRISLKWPNDIMVSFGHGARHTAKKLGGILIEVAEHSGQVVLLVGLGLNLLSAPDQLETAGAVEDCAIVQATIPDTESPVDSFGEVLALLPDLAQGIRLMHERFIEGGFAYFRETWLHHSLFVPDSTVLHLDLGERQVHGTFEGVDSSGALLVRSPSHEVLSISSAHVVSWSNREKTGSHRVRSV